MKSIIERIKGLFTKQSAFDKLQKKSKSEIYVSPIKEYTLNELREKLKEFENLPNNETVSCYLTYIKFTVS